MNWFHQSRSWLIYGPGATPSLTTYVTSSIFSIIWLVHWVISPVPLWYYCLDCSPGRPPLSSFMISEHSYDHIMQFVLSETWRFHTQSLNRKFSTERNRYSFPASLGHAISFLHFLLCNFWEAGRTMLLHRNVGSSEWNKSDRHMMILHWRAVCQLRGLCSSIPASHYCGYFGRQFDSCGRQLGCKMADVSHRALLYMQLADKIWRTSEADIGDKWAHLADCRRRHRKVR